MRAKIIKIINTEIVKHKDLAEKYLSCVTDSYKKKYSFINWLFSFIKPNKADKTDLVKSYFKNYKYHKIASAEFEILKYVVSHVIQRLIKLKKNKQTIKAEVLELIDRKMNAINRYIKSSQIASTEYECYLRLYYGYNSIKLQIEKL